eukprot:TRINITY_DN17389_c0_g1_i2.p1 TRINITY_DN17389_c0_g1~~TRINITY_DN17389_c0_g1_i2.p1  ORF type:complete len:805 (-),score=287.97 TRINITY_DN17389_c0_g1_i2:412-2826(-)
MVQKASARVDDDGKALLEADETAAAAAVTPRSQKVKKSAKDKKSEKKRSRDQSPEKEKSTKKQKKHSEKRSPVRRRLSKKQTPQSPPLPKRKKEDVDRKKSSKKDRKKEEQQKKRRKSPTTSSGTSSSSRKSTASSGDSDEGTEETRPEEKDTQPAANAGKPQRVTLEWMVTEAAKEHAEQQEAIEEVLEDCPAEEEDEMQVIHKGCIVNKKVTGPHQLKEAHGEWLAVVVLRLPLALLKECGRDHMSMLYSLRARCANKHSPPALTTKSGAITTLTHAMRKVWKDGVLKLVNDFAGWTKNDAFTKGSPQDAEEDFDKAALRKKFLEKAAETMAKKQKRHLHTWQLLLDGFNRLKADFENAWKGETTLYAWLPQLWEEHRTRKTTAAPTATETEMPPPGDEASDRPRMQPPTERSSRSKWGGGGTVRSGMSSDLEGLPPDSVATAPPPEWVTKLCGSKRDQRSLQWLIMAEDIHDIESFALLCRLPAYKLEEATQVTGMTTLGRAKLLQVVKCWKNQPDGYATEIFETAVASRVDKMTALPTPTPPHQEMSTLMAEVGLKKNGIKTLQDSVEEWQRRCTEAEAKMTTLQQSQKDIEALRNSLAAAESKAARADGLESSLAEARSNLEKARQEATDLGTELSLALAEVKSLKAEPGSAQSEADLLKSKVKSLEEQIKQAAEDVDIPSMADAKCAAAEERAKTAEERATELKDQLQKNEADRLKEMEEKKAEVESKGAAIKTLQGEMAVRDKAQQAWREKADARAAANEKKFNALQKELEKTADGKKLWKQAQKAIEAAAKEAGGD